MLNKWFSAVVKRSERGVGLLQRPLLRGAAGRFSTEKRTRPSPFINQMAKQQQASQIKNMNVPRYDELCKRQWNDLIEEYRSLASYSRETGPDPVTEAKLNAFESMYKERALNFEFKVFQEFLVNVPSSRKHVFTPFLAANADTLFEGFSRSLVVNHLLNINRLTVDDRHLIEYKSRMFELLLQAWRKEMVQPNPSSLTQINVVQVFTTLMTICFWTPALSALLQLCFEFALQRMFLHDLWEKVLNGAAAAAYTLAFHEPLSSRAFFHQSAAALMAAPVDQVDWRRLVIYLNFAVRGRQIGSLDLLAVIDTILQHHTGLPVLDLVTLAEIVQEVSDCTNARVSRIFDEIARLPPTVQKLEKILILYGFQLARGCQKPALETWIAKALTLVIESISDLEVYQVAKLISSFPVINPHESPFQRTLAYYFEQLLIFFVKTRFRKQPEIVYCMPKFAISPNQKLFPELFGQAAQKAYFLFSDALHLFPSSLPVHAAIDSWPDLKPSLLAMPEIAGRLKRDMGVLEAIIARQGVHNLHRRVISFKEIIDF